MRSWGNTSSVLAIKCHQMNQLAISLFSEVHVVEINQTLRGKKKSMLKKLLVFRFTRSRAWLQSFLLLSHFSVQLAMVGLLNTIPGRSSVQFSCSVVSDSLRPHGLQLARPLCPSPTPIVYLSSFPLDRKSVV